MGERVGLRVVEPAVVHGLGHPDPAVRIHVDVGGVEEHRRLGPEADLEILGQHELIAELLASRLRASRKEREDRDDRAGPGTHGGEYSVRSGASGRTGQLRELCG